MHALLIIILTIDLFIFLLIAQLKLYSLAQVEKWLRQLKLYSEIKRKTFSINIWFRKNRKLFFHRRRYK